MHNEISIADNNSIRIEWLDLLKVYAIFLVFVGHKVDNVFLEQVIYSFHIPLFFWISGYVFDQSKYRDLKKFLIRKVNTLIVPYFVFAFFSYLFWFLVVRSLSIRGQALSENVFLPFWGIFYGVGIAPWKNPLDVALWFLPCLFITEIFFWLISKYSKRVMQTIIVILSLIIGYCTTKCMPFRIPWSIDVSFSAVFFYYLGYLTRSLDDRLYNIRFVWRILTIFFLALMVVFLSKINGKSDMNYNYYGNFLLFLSGAISGIYFSYFIIQKFPVLRIMSYIGRNTIILVGLGGVSSFFIRGILYLVSSALFTGGKVHLIESIIYSCLEIFLLIPFMYLINNYLPFIIGREKG